MSLVEASVRAGEAQGKWRAGRIQPERRLAKSAGDKRWGPCRDKRVVICRSGKFEDVDVVVVEAAKRRCCSRYCSRNGADDVDMETVEVDVAG